MAEEGRRVPLEEGREFSNYRVLGPLGKGAMGMVFRARDLRLGRDVAMKVLPPELAEHPDRLRRLEREARLLASLNHPNIAQIYTVEVQDSTSVLVLEMVEGEDLAARLARGALPLEDVRTICTQMAEALEAAHDAGVIHRDLKPANVRITPRGAVKLLDFGLARSWRAGAETQVESLTGKNVLVGTPAYMSPEALRGGAVDRRTDIWAFGCILHECLAGKRPFAGDTLPDVVASILGDAPDLSHLPPETPPRIRRLITRCLHKDPRLRLQDIGEARITLTTEEDLTEEPVGFRAAGAPSRLRRSWPIGALLLLAAGLLAGRTWFSIPGPRNPLDGASFRKLTETSATEFGAALSPDGKWVAFVSDRDGPFDLFVGQVEDGHYENRTQGHVKRWLQDLRDIGFSADSTEVWIAGGRGRRVRSAPIQGGQFQPLLDEKAVDADWSGDGSRVVYHTNQPGDPVYVTKSGEQARTPVLRGKPGFHQHFPKWSLDDSWIFLARGRQATGDMDLWRMRPDGTGLKQLTHEWKHVQYPTPIDDRTVLFIANDSTGAGLSIFSLDLPSGRVRRGNIGLERFRSLSASRNGRRLVATVANPEVGLWTVPIRDEPATEGDVKRLEGSFPVRALAPRVHGRDLYFLSSRGTGDGLWRRRGETLLEIWQGSRDPLLWVPSVSPDGRHVALSLRRGDRMQLFVLNADGSGGLRPLAAGLDVRGSSSWSRDGAWIAIAGADERGARLFKVEVKSGTPKRLADGEALDPVWSPTEDWIVYCGKQLEGYFHLHAIRPDGQTKEFPKIEVRRSGERCRFLPDGSGLVYMKGVNLAQDFYLLDFSSMRSRPLTHFQRTDTMRTFDISPDGKRIIFDREHANSDVVLIDLPKRR